MRYLTLAEVVESIAGFWKRLAVVQGSAIRGFYGREERQLAGC